MEQFIDAEQRDIQEQYERDIQERQQLVTPDVFKNGNESEDSEDHLNATLEEIPNVDEPNDAQDPEDSGEHN